MPLRPLFTGADLGRIKGEGAGDVHSPPPPEMTCGFLIQMVFGQKKTMWFIGVEVEQEMSAPPPKNNPGSALALEGIFLYKVNVFGVAMAVI